MKEEIKISNSLGFCKRCWRTRREGSAYCGQCRNEPERMKIYQDKQKYFPNLLKVARKLDVHFRDLDRTVFAYGDTIYSDFPISSNLLAHELTHIFQQIKMGADIWWEKYLKNKKFRLSQEVEAYQQQYKVIENSDSDNASYYLDKLARDLSGKLYGFIVSYDEAVKLIKGLKH